MVKEETPLISHKKPLEYFMEAVNRSIERHNLQTSEEVPAHLAFMLRDFISPDSYHKITITIAYRPDNGKKDGEIIKTETTPLAYLWKQAYDTEGPTMRFSRFIDVGDRSLFIAGFCEGWLHSRRQDTKYCINIGQHAYEEAASIASCTRTLKSTSPLYEELSEMFPDLITIVSEAVEAEVLLHDKDKIKAIIRYLRKGNKQVLATLLEQNINPLGLEQVARHMETKELENLAKHLVLGTYVVNIEGRKA